MRRDHRKGPATSDTVLSEWVDQASEWLAEHTHSNLGFERTLRRQRWRAAGNLSIYQTPQGVEGVSMATPAGDWYLEALHATAAGSLAATVSAHTPPHVLTTSIAAREWIRPLLHRFGGVQREHTLIAMICRAAPTGGRGRWAVENDLGALRALPAAQLVERDPGELIRRRQIAVLDDRSDASVAVITDDETTHYACIADCLFDEADAESRRLASMLLAFVVHALLAHRNAVHMLVDAEHAARIALYRAVGFHTVGTCYRAQLRRKDRR